MEAKVGRNRELYEKRLKGATFKELGEEYGISPSAANSVFKKEKLAVERMENPLYV